VSVPERLTMEGVTPGMELGEVVFGPLQRSDIVRYAGASGDFNPLHIDETYARESGAPGVFAMGLLAAGYLAHALSDWFGGPQHIRRYKTRFVERVWPGDELVCAGRVDEIEEGCISVRLEARRRGPGPRGEVSEEVAAVVGQAVVELPE
jgi:acyl dehydratase